MADPNPTIQNGSGRLSGILGNHGAILEEDENFDDDSSLDEDEFNVNIQKSNHINNNSIDNNDYITRSQTNPHGDLSQYDYQYKNNKDKHVIKNRKKNKKSKSKPITKPKSKLKAKATSSSNIIKKKKNKKKKNSSSNPKYVSKHTDNYNSAAHKPLPPTKPKMKKSKSEHGYNKNNNKKKLKDRSNNYKKSYKRDDEDEIDVESLDDDDFDPNYSITDDDQYMNMSITSQDLAMINDNNGNGNGSNNRKKSKTSSTLDLMKKKFSRLVSPDKMSAGSGSNNNNVIDPNYNARDNSPVDYNNNSLNALVGRPNSSSKSNSNSVSDDKSNRKDSGSSSRKDSDGLGSHIKKSSVSFLTGSSNILSKGKGLFRRDNSNNNNNNGVHNTKQTHSMSLGNNADHKNNSKTNLTNIKAKFMNIKKSYSSKNLMSQTPTGKQEQNMGNRKKDDKKKRDKKSKSSKKYKNNKDKIMNNNKSINKYADKYNKSKKSKKIKDNYNYNNSGQIRKRSASQNAENVANAGRYRKSKPPPPPPGPPPKHKNKNKIKNKNKHKNNQHGDNGIKAPSKRSMTVKPKDQTLVKRHSMQPVTRSKSQNRMDPQMNKNTKSSSINPPSNKNKNKLNPADLAASARRPHKNNGHHQKKSKDDKLALRKSVSDIPSDLKSKKRKKMINNGKNINTNNDDDDDNKTATVDNRRDKNKLGVDANKKKRSASRDNNGKKIKKKKTYDIDDDMIKADKKCKFRIKNEIFELYEYYKPIRLIGSGAYAVVCEAIDERTKKRVAIKKNKHIFDDIRDARRILRECKLLLHFTRFKHPDLIEIYDSLPPSISEIQTFEDVYIVMPLLESNLCKIITSKQKLSNLHYQYLTYQVLRGLKFIHESGVIHRDIKPENILLNGSDCDVKIIDFGLARGVIDPNDNDDNAKATEYVCTRWYRSPEVMCSGGKYNEKMDIWGVGCILAEMILRRPLFPGANYLDQLQQIFDIMGTPANSDWILNDQARSWVQKLPKHNGKNFKKMLQHKFVDAPNDLNHCVDLLYKLLELNPKDRISAGDSLKHPYFKDMHDEDEILTGEQFDLSFEFEKSIKTKFGVRHMMYSALNEFHKKQWNKIKKKQKKRALRKLKAANSTGGNQHHHSSSSSKHKHKKHRASKHRNTTSNDPNK